MSLPPKILGIGALKPRLSTVLKDQIVSELPDLIRDIQEGIEDSRSTLIRLGEARGTLQEQRLYLVHVSQSFASLVKAAVDGVYVHEFFGDAMTLAGFRKRLRAVVQDVLLEFAGDMRREGHSQEITDDPPSQEKASTPTQISRSDFLDGVRELVRRSRGCELPGTFNPLIVGDLFYQQSKPWKRLVQRYSERILDATRTSLELISLHTADETTSGGLLRELIDPAMEKYADQLESKVAEVLRPHQQGHPITYNHYFTETIQKARNEHAKKDQARQLNVFFKIKPEMGSSYVGDHQGFYTGELLEALNHRTEADMDRYACSEAVDCMEAYYKVAMKVMVDNFGVLGIESCILDGLSDTFSPDTVMRLDDSLIRNIAAETEESQTERARTIKKLTSLVAGLQTLNRLNRNKPAADQLDEALDRSGIDREVAVEKVDASMNGGLIREQEAPMVQDIRASEAPLPEPHESTWNLSSFREDAKVRADVDWLNNGFNGLRTSKTKKDKKMAKANNEEKWFG